MHVFSNPMLSTLGAALLAALAVSGSPAPALKDVHATTMALDHDGVHSTNHFEVTIQRQDTLVDEDSNATIGTRIHAIRMAFDVQSGQVHCGGVQMEPGLTRRQFQSMTMTVVNTDADAAKQEEAQQTWNKVGLANVEMDVQVEELRLASLATFRRVTIRERIVEINEESIDIQEVVVHAVDLLPGNLVRWHEPKVEAPSDNGASQVSVVAGSPSMHEQTTASAEDVVKTWPQTVALWLHRQPAALRALIVGTYAMMVVCLIVSLVASMRFWYDRSKYARLGMQETMILDGKPVKV